MVIRFLINVEELSKKEIILKIESFRDYILDPELDYEEYGDFLIDSNAVFGDDAVKMFEKLIDHINNTAVEKDDGVEIIGIKDNVPSKDSGDIELGHLDFENSILLVPSYDNILESISIKLSDPFGAVSDFDGDIPFKNKNLGITIDMNDNEGNYWEGKI